MVQELHQVPGTAGSTNSDTDGREKKQQRPGSLRQYSVDTSRAKSNAEAVRQCIDKLGWQDYSEPRKDRKPCDIYWHNIVYSDMKDVVPPGSKVNKFPGLNELSRKISLTRSVLSMQKLFPDQFDFCPRSWFIPAQLEQFYEDYYSGLETNTVPWYIVKPDEGAQGCGIYLIHAPEQLQNLDQPQLIQEYISEPFLLQDNLKFDFRVYAVIKSLNPLAIYISREGMARFCTQKYRLPSVSNQNQAFMHLTNYSLNKTNTDYVHSNSLENQGSKRLLSTVFHQMDSKGINTKKVWHNIKLIVVKTILAMVPEMILMYESHFSGTVMQGPQCFHILGFDVLLTKNLDPILLEINACPSMSVGHETVNEDGSEAENKENHKVHSVVDEAIKIPLIRDTLLLVMDKLPHHRGSINSAGSVRRMRTSDDTELPYHGRPSLREIFPSRHGHSCSHLLVLDRAAYLYMQFISVKRSLQITMTGLRTFIRKCKLDEVIGVGDLENQLVKIQKNFQGQVANGIPFHGYVDLLLVIARRKYPESDNLVEALRSLLQYCQLQLRHHGVRSARLRAAETQPENQEDEQGRPSSLKQIYLLPNRLSGNRGYQKILKELKKQKERRKQSADSMRIRRSESEGRLAKRNQSSAVSLPKLV